MRRRLALLVEAIAMICALRHSHPAFSEDRVLAEMKYLQIFWYIVPKRGFQGPGNLHFFSRRFLKSFLENQGTYQTRKGSCAN